MLKSADIDVAEKTQEWLASCNRDPYAFVMGAFPWGEPGTSLAKYDGPDEWQKQVLEDIAAGLIDTNTAIQLAVASGHGIGKSALICWIILWAFCTAPDTKGVVTANTETQLRTKTWAELGKWFNLFVARQFFTLTATALLSKDPSRERTWRIDATPWSASNPAAFAGLHNKGKRLLLLMDEASEIADIIHEVAEGALTDSETEIIWIMFGNPTKNSGRFKEAFPGGKFERFWKTRQIDSRTVKITNKGRIAQWEHAYGADSDFFRIRVLGEFPRTGLMEFFNANDVAEAMKREVETSLSDPLALGVDVARFGANNSVLFPRKGRDARTIDREVHSGLDTVALAQRIYEVYNWLKPDGILVDGGGVGGGVVDNCRRQRLHVYEVQFGGKDDVGGSPWGIEGERYANKRAAMYGALRAWLKSGAIPNDEGLRQQFMSIRYTFNKRDEILLVAKEDLMDEDGNGISVDDLDALALTFAYPIQPADRSGGLHAAHRGPAMCEFEYNPYQSEESYG